MTDDAQSTIAQAPDEEDVTTALYRAAIGPLNSNYYLPIFSRFEVVDRAGISWNWAAGLCTLGWLILRQLWTAALAYASIVLALVLLVFGIGRSVLQLPDALIMALGLGFGLAAFVLPGLFGNALFHRECRRRMSKALAAHANVADACTQLMQQAPTRKRAIWVAAINAGLVLAVLLAYWGFSSLNTLTAMPEGAVDDDHTTAGHNVEMAVPGNAPAAASSPTADQASTPTTATSAPTPVASTPLPAASSASMPVSIPTPTMHASMPKAITAAASVPTASASSASASASAPTVHASVAMPVAAHAPSVLPAAAPSSSIAASAVHAASAAGRANTASAPVTQSSAASATATVSPFVPAAQPVHTPASATAAGRITDNTAEEKPSAPVAETKPHKAAASDTPVPKATAKSTQASAPTTVHAAAPAQFKHTAKAAAKSATKPYFINVGLFVNPDNAINANNKLLEAHLPSVTKELKSSKVPLLIRVRVGPFDSEKQAKAAVEKIKSLQLDAVIVQP